MAPPKRKTGGRVTPSGTRPGDRATTRKPDAQHDSGDAGRVTSSSRYTPPVPKSQTESPSWVPVLMLALFIVGALSIMSRYLIWDEGGNQIPLLVGMVCLLGGLYTATKWR